MTWEVVRPAGLAPPSGFSHGMLGSSTGRLLFIAGQTATDPTGRVVPGDFVAQFGQALRNCIAVVRQAGGKVEDIGRVTIYVKDMAAYRAARAALASVWREIMDRHYPAAALVGVEDLVDEGALVEIEAIALIPDRE